MKKETKNFLLVETLTIIIALIAIFFAFHFYEEYKKNEQNAGEYLRQEQKETQEAILTENRELKERLKNKEKDTSEKKSNPEKVDINGTINHTAKAFLESWTKKNNSDPNATYEDEMLKVYDDIRKYCTDKAYAYFVPEEAYNLYKNTPNDEKQKLDVKSNGFKYQCNLINFRNFITLNDTENRAEVLMFYGVKENIEFIENPDNNYNKEIFSVLHGEMSLENDKWKVDTIYLTMDFQPSAETKLLFKP